MRKRIMSNRGSAMAYVMMSLVVIFILVSIVASLAQTNTLQAGVQEKGLEAYYIARSGAELTYEAVMNTDASLLNQFVAKFDSGTMPPGGFKSNDIDFEKGKANVTVIIKTVTEDGTPVKKVLISSEGILNDRDIKKNVTLEFYVDYKNKPGMVWSR